MLGGEQRAVMSVKSPMLLLMLLLVQGGQSHVFTWKTPMTRISLFEVLSLLRVQI